jgi:hypothetical protein
MSVVNGGVGDPSGSLGGCFAAPGALSVRSRLYQVPSTKYQVPSTSSRSVLIAEERLDLLDEVVGEVGIELGGQQVCVRIVFEFGEVAGKVV